MPSRAVPRANVVSRLDPSTVAVSSGHSACPTAILRIRGLLTPRGASRKRLASSAQVGEVDQRSARSHGVNTAVQPAREALSRGRQLQAHRSLVRKTLRPRRIARARHACLRTRSQWWASTLSDDRRALRRTPLRGHCEHSHHDAIPRTRQSRACASRPPARQRETPGVAAGGRCWHLFVSRSGVRASRAPRQ